eukprot:UN04665
MTVYTGLTMKAIQDVAKDDPYVLAGDFNQDPETDAYSLLSEGKDTEIIILNSYLELVRLFCKIGC